MIKKLIFLLVIFSIFLLLKPTSPLPIPISQLTTHFSTSPQPITLIAVGDIMLGRSVNSKMRRLGDFSYPFLETWKFLASSDLTFGNLESPLVSGCPTTNTGMTFCADPKAIEGLTKSGFDILSLANNHVLNYGQGGLSQTIEILQNNNIYPLLQGKEQIIEIKKTRFGFLGFDLTSSYNQKQILEKIKEEKTRVDILIVSFHWGEEYVQKPSQRQINLAHQAVDSGTDLILGHHPHVIQPTEEYKGKLIIYSLGNFIFDQPWSEETKRGLVGKFIFLDKKLVKKEFLEIYIKDFCQPEFVSFQPEGLGE